MRSLTIALGPTATDSAVASLAALQALRTLRLGLTKATNVRLSSWPTFHSLTRLALMMSITRADGAVSPAAAVAALSALPLAASAALVDMRMVVHGIQSPAQQSWHLPNDELDGWYCVPPDLSPLASLTRLRTLTWESRGRQFKRHPDWLTDPRTPMQMAMVANVRRVAASLPRIATTVRLVRRGDPWGPERLYRSFASQSHPVGGKPNDAVEAQGV